MGQPPKIVYTDGETGIRNRCISIRTILLFITPEDTLPSPSDLFAPFLSMLDKRIKPGQQWTELIYPILLTYNNKLVHSDTEMTPKEGSKQVYELQVFVNLKLKAKHSRKYPPFVVCDIARPTPSNSRLTKAMSRSGPMLLTR